MHVLNVNADDTLPYTCKGRYHVYADHTLMVFLNLHAVVRLDVHGVMTSTGSIDVEQCT